MKNGNKSTTEDLSLDCRDLAKNPALTERNCRMLAEVADRLLSLERERDFARFREDSARNVMRKYMRELEQLRAEVGDDPLTLEELRGMDGEPVWVEFVGKPDGSPIPPLWMLVDVGSKQLVTGAEFVDWREESWFAYRRKPAPEEGEKNV